MQTNTSPTVHTGRPGTNSTFTPRPSTSTEPTTVVTEPTPTAAAHKGPIVTRSQSQPVPGTDPARGAARVLEPRPRQATFAAAPTSVPPATTSAPSAPPDPAPGAHLNLPQLTRTPSPISNKSDPKTASAGTSPETLVPPHALPRQPVDRGDMLYVESSRSYSRVKFTRHIDMRTTVVRPKITALTAAFLTMHLRDDLDAALKVFMFAPSLVASDIRRAKLSKVVGYTRTKSLLEALLSRMHERKAYTTDDECLGAACNLLVAYLARDDTATTKLLNFRPSDSESPAKIHHRLKTLFRFVPNMYREDLALYGVRVGLVYGALAIFMNEKEVKLERQNRMLAAGLGAATAVVSAAADSVPSAAKLAGATVKLSVKVAQDEMTDFMAREQKKLAQIVAVVAHKFNIQVLRAAQMGRLASLRAPIQPTAADLDKFQRIASTVLQMVVFEAGIALAIEEVKAADVPPVPEANGPPDAESNAATGGYGPSRAARARVSPTRAFAQAQRGHAADYPVLAVGPDSSSNAPSVRGRSPSVQGVPPPAPPAPSGALAQSSTEAHFVVHETFGRPENITKASAKLRGQIEAKQRAQALAAASARKPLPPPPSPVPEPVGRRHSETSKPYAPAPDASPNPRRILRPARSFTNAEPPPGAPDASPQPSSSAGNLSDGVTLSPPSQPQRGDSLDSDDTAHWLAYADMLDNDADEQWWAAHEARIRAVIDDAFASAFHRFAAPPVPAPSWSAETQASMMMMMTTQPAQRQQLPPLQPVHSSSSFEPHLSPVAEAMSRGPSGNGTDVGMLSAIGSDMSGTGTAIAPSTTPPLPEDSVVVNTNGRPSPRRTVSLDSPGRTASRALPTVTKSMPNVEEPEESGV